MADKQSYARAVSPKVPAAGASEPGPSQARAQPMSSTPMKRSMAVRGITLSWVSPIKPVFARPSVLAFDDWPALTDRVYERSPVSSHGSPTKNKKYKWRPLTFRTPEAEGSFEAAKQERKQVHDKQSVRVNLMSRFEAVASPPSQKPAPHQQSASAKALLSREPVASTSKMPTRVFTSKTRQPVQLRQVSAQPAVLRRLSPNQSRRASPTASRVSMPAPVRASATNTAGEQKRKLPTSPRGSNRFSVLASAGLCEEKDDWNNDDASSDDDDPPMPLQRPPASKNAMSTQKSNKVLTRGEKALLEKTLPGLMAELDALGTTVTSVKDYLYDFLWMLRVDDKAGHMRKVGEERWGKIRKSVAVQTSRQARGQKEATPDKKHATAQTSPQTSPSRCSVESWNDRSSLIQALQQVGLSPAQVSFRSDRTRSSMKFDDQMQVGEGDSLSSPPSYANMDPPSPPEPVSLHHSSDSLPIPVNEPDVPRPSLEIHRQPVSSRPLTVRAASEAYRHLRTTSDSQSWQGSMDDILPQSTIDTYVIAPGEFTSLDVLEGTIHDAVSRQARRGDLVNIFLHCQDLDDVPVTGGFVSSDPFPMDLAMQTIEKVQQSKRSVMMKNELQVKVYTLRVPELRSAVGREEEQQQQQTSTDSAATSAMPSSRTEQNKRFRGSGRPRFAFIEDEADVSGSGSSDDESDNESNASTLEMSFIAKEDISDDEEQGHAALLLEQRRNEEHASEFVTRHLQRGILYSLLTDSDSTHPTPDDAVATECESSVLPRPRTTTLFAEPLQRAGVPVSRLASAGAEKSDQFRVPPHLLTVAEIVKRKVFIDTSNNCFPYSVVYCIINLVLSGQISYPSQLLGAAASVISNDKSKLAKFMQSFVRRPVSRGPHALSWGDMVSYLMKSAPRSFRMCLEDRQILEVSFATGVATEETAAVMGRLLSKNHISLVIFGDMGQIVYSSPYSKQNNIIYIALKDEHYYPITKLNENVYCARCNVVYKDNHKCPDLCIFCQREECDVKEANDVSDIWQCSCSLIFRNEKCLSLHKEVCEFLCSDCGRKKTKGHDCSSWVCYTCKFRAVLGHQCYIYRLFPKAAVTWYMFYDIESAVVKKIEHEREVSVHVPVMVCLTLRCPECRDAEDRELCGGKLCINTDFKFPQLDPETLNSEPDDPTELGVGHNAGMVYEYEKRLEGAKKECPTEEHSCGKEITFTGKTCITDFVHFIEKWCNRRKGDKNVIFAHCGGRFDHHMVFRELLIQGLKPNVIMKGNKFISISVQKWHVKFLDSYRFIPLPLTKFQKTLGLDIEYQKGYWPHSLTTTDLLDLPQFPSKDSYEYSLMDDKEKQAFDSWYDVQDKQQGFKTKDEMEKYCKQDVRVLAEGVLQFRRLWLDARSGKYGNFDPFYDKPTLPGAVMQFFRTQYLGERRLPVTPANGYNAIKRSSAIGTQWLNGLEKKERITIMREQFIGTDFVFDGVLYDENKTPLKMYDFLGCYYHACDCRKYHKGPIVHIDRTAASRENPEPTLKLISRSKLHADVKRRELFCRKHNYEYVTMKECDYKNEVAALSPEERVKWKKELANVFRLKEQSVMKHRKGMHGGRTECFKLHYKCKPGERILYYDVSGLYPHILMSNPFCKEHPQRLSQDEIDIFSQPDPLPQIFLLKQHISDLTGKFTHNYFLRLKIVAPRDLEIPYLPTKINDRLVFANCRSCAEENMTDMTTAYAHASSCNHSFEQRAFEVYVHSLDLLTALELGYGITRYIDGEKYELEMNIFTEFIATCMKEKKRAELSGNEGRRFIEKLKANSFWGVFAKNNNFTETKICDKKQLLQLVSDASIKIISAVSFGELAKVEFKTKRRFRKTLPDTSLINASMVTSYARNNLYNFLILVGHKNLCYCDTDSIMFVHRDGTENPLEPFLTGILNPPPPTTFDEDYYGDTDNLAGTLDDEILKDFPNVSVGEAVLRFEIRHFVAAGPKEYGYKIFREDAPYDDSVEPHATVTKCKGLTLSGQAMAKFDFEYLQKLIFEEKGSPIPQTRSFVLDKRSNIKVLQAVKQPKFAFAKRVWRVEQGESDNFRDSEISTMPFGYTMSADGRRISEYERQLRNSVPLSYTEREIEEEKERQIEIEEKRKAEAEAAEEAEIRNELLRIVYDVRQRIINDQANVDNLLKKRSELAAERQQAIARRGFQNSLRRKIDEKVSAGLWLESFELADDDVYVVTKIETNDGQSLYPDTNPLIGSLFQSPPLVPTLYEEAFDKFLFKDLSSDDEQKIDDLSSLVFAMLYHPNKLFRKFHVSQMQDIAFYTNKHNHEPDVDYEIDVNGEETIIECRFPGVTITPMTGL